MKISLPIKTNDRQAVHYNSSGEVDYSFECLNNFIDVIIIYKNSNYFVLPQIDYDDNDEYLENRDLESVTNILQKDVTTMQNDKKFGWMFLQNHLIKCLTISKTAIANDVFNKITKVADSRRPANVVVTGNACMFIPSEDYYTDTKTNINLILPEDMGLYKITIYRYQGREQYLIVTPKIIETEIETYGAPNIRIKPIHSWESKDLKLKVDQTKVFNRQTVSVETCHKAENGLN